MIRCESKVALVSLLGMLLSCSQVSAEQIRLPGWKKKANPAKDNTEMKTKKYLSMKTMGGRQFWGDVMHYSGWRIQQNVFTKHYRLLDEKDYRHHFGSLEACQEHFEKVKRTRNLQPNRGKVVVAIHGMIRSSKSFTNVPKKLKEKGYEMIGFDYPSTRMEITQSAEYLHQFLSSLTEVDEIHLIVHSMGGLVVRAYFDKYDDERIKRLVMWGVPNHGANLADMFKKWPIYKGLFGPGAQQLVTDPDGLIAKLPIPRCEFGIVAGGKGNDKGFNPLIPGDDDATVSVASTRLPGASDFVRVKCMHSVMMYNSDIADVTVRYIETGCFHEDGKKDPIPLPEPE